MKIRRYIAKDMRQALAQIREAQGPDAVILSSRRNTDGVEVVAAIDFEAETVISESVAEQQAARKQSQAAAAPAIWRPEEVSDFARTLQTATQVGSTQFNSTAFNSNQGNAAQNHSPQANANRDAQGAAQTSAVNAARARHELTDENQADVGSELRTLRRMLETQLATLAWNDLTRRAPMQTALLKELTQLGLCHMLAAEVVAQVPARHEWLEAQRLALAMVAKRINITQERWLEQGGMVAMVGPTGVGKTTLVAKLAARWVLRHGPRDLVLVSADSVRMGAQDQIQNLGRLLGVPTYSVDHLSELSSLLAGVDKTRLVLIDTAGLSPRDPRLAAELALLATSHPQLETSLVVSANSQAGSLEESFIRFLPAAPKSCVLTKVDEAVSLGGSISALARHELPLMYISEGQRIPEDLLPARGHQLVARAVELARRSHAQTEEELLSMRFGGMAHAFA